MKIRIAVAGTSAAANRIDLDTLVDGLEARGFDTLWLSDTPLTPAVEPLTALALAAGRTRRLKLGTNVVVPGRNPLLLAKTLAHLDELSEGRLLLAFMPGIGSPRERAALGSVGIDRNQLMAETLDLCRRWWSGEAVTAASGDFRFDAVRVEPRPRQKPLEVWLGGNGPKGIELAARLGDGWLGARVGPTGAGRIRREIIDGAERAGRLFDPEHFGLSIPYARQPPDETVVAAVLARAVDGDAPVERASILPVGPAELVELVERHIEAGVSKFVLRPMNEVGDPDGWEGELDYLAEHVLVLQT